MYAVKKLFDEYLAVHATTDSGKGSDITMKRQQGGVKSARNLAITRPHAGASLAAEETQSLIARITFFVTPKLLCRLWL